MVCEVDTGDHFVQESVTILARWIKEDISSKGRCVVGLSGGSTPKTIYLALRDAEGIDWTKVVFYLVDERHIEHSSPLSNFHLITSTLAPLNLVTPVPPPDSASHEESVKKYGDAIQTLLEPSQGATDIVVLGMGTDGHIASLFPHTRWSNNGTAVVGTETDVFDVRQRISVSVEVLTKSRRALFLLKGAEKRKVWDQMKSEQDVVSGGRWPALEVVKHVKDIVVHFGT